LRGIFDTTKLKVASLVALEKIDVIAYVANQEVMDLRTESDNIFFKKLDKLSSVIFFSKIKEMLIKKIKKERL
jgi:hypothetical protein